MGNHRTVTAPGVAQAGGRATAGIAFQTATLIGFLGIAQFSVWAGRGVYKACEIDVTKAGWLYHPGMDRESCSVFKVP